MHGVKMNLHLHRHEIVGPEAIAHEVRTCIAVAIRTGREHVRAQREFENSIAHLTPQRQAELIALRQIGLDKARRLRP